MRRAAREKWGVPDEAKTEALFQAVKILTAELSSDRLKLAAMRFLVAADRTDIVSELGLAKLELARLKLKTDGPDEGAPKDVDPAAAEQALKVLNGEQPDRPPEHPAADP